MIYEHIGSLRIPKIGYGTWRIGGDSAPDFGQDANSLAALRSALELGYTYFDTAEMYANGHAEELIRSAVQESGIPREQLFITSKVKPEHLRYEQVLKACAGSLKRLDTEYLDLYLIHWPSSGMNLADTFRALNKLVREGKVRNLGVSNFDLKLLKRSQELSETPILTDQVPYSLFDRSYAKSGVLEYCQAKDILFTAYSPLKYQSVRMNQSLSTIAEVHSVTSQQIALAWLVAQPCVITIPMSNNPRHQRENLEAADIELTVDEMQQLNSIAS